MVSVSGCHVDMWRQPKIKPYWQSDFFNDQQGSRPQVANTVARGRIISDDVAYYTGRGEDGKLLRTIPVRAVQSFASPKDMLLRGQSRYNAYCSPCHGRTGNGNGFISQRGLGYWSKLPASYQTERLRKVEDGHLYDTLVNGFGIMYGYGARIQDVNDRWAVVAYVRALQLAGGTSTGTVAPAPTPETEVSGTSAKDLSAPGTVEPPVAGTANNPRSGVSVPATQNVPATESASGSIPDNPTNAPEGTIPGKTGNSAPAPPPGSGMRAPGADRGTEAPPPGPATATPAGGTP
jgi:mono/diheme cytochrome c family protein